MKISVILIGLLMASAVASAEDTPWKGKMRQLSAALSETIPLLYPDPGQDSKVLTEKVKKIRDLTKDLDGRFNHGMVAPDADPALPYIAKLFRSDMDQALESLEQGHSEYAKGVIRNSVAYCVACHTRSQGGVEFPLLKAFEQPLKKVSWIEKIEIQTATRQFDEVLNQVMSRLAQPAPAGTNALDLERAARMALSIAVRVKKDPVRAQFLTQAIIKSPSASDYMKRAAKIWAKDIGEWQKEKVQEFTTDKQLVEFARALIAIRPSDDLNTGPHIEVRLLRASNLMHDVLRRFPNSPYVADALYTIGQSYAVLRDLGLWSLHEMYFQACIEKVPHTELARKCYADYEESMTIVYSGSAGVFMPGAMSRHLARLKELAAPVDAKRPKK